MVRWLRLTSLGMVLAIAIALVFAYVRSPIDPLAFDPPPQPALTGVWSPGNSLCGKVLGRPEIVGPEDVARDAFGAVYGGTADGKIMRVRSDGTLEVFADTGGRPLGLDFGPEGDLFVADAIRGVMVIDPQGEVRTLVDAEGSQLGFTDDLDVGRDGTIYFSDASRFGMYEHMYDLLEGRPYGRLLRYRPATRELTVLHDGLYFANGVALSRDEDFVVVSETYRFRLIRVWLEGPRAGTHDVFAEDLPGYPDGVSSDAAGNFWIGFFTVRNAAADWLAPRPWAKRLLAGLPAVFFPKAAHYGLVAQLDARGRPVRSFHDPSGECAFNVTSVEHDAGELLLGTLEGTGIVRVPLSAKDSG